MDMDRILVELHDAEESYEYLLKKCEFKEEVTFDDMEKLVESKCRMHHYQRRYEMELSRLQNPTKIDLNVNTLHIVNDTVNDKIGRFKKELEGELSDEN